VAAALPTTRIVLLWNLDRIYASYLGRRHKESFRRETRCVLPGTCRLEVLAGVPLSPESFRLHFSYVTMTDVRCHAMCTEPATMKCENPVGRQCRGDGTCGTLFITPLARALPLVNNVGG